MLEDLKTLCDNCLSRKVTNELLSAKNEEINWLKEEIKDMREEVKQLRKIIWEKSDICKYPVCQ